VLSSSNEDTEDSVLEAEMVERAGEEYKDCVEEASMASKWEKVKWETLKTTATATATTTMMMTRILFY